MAALAPFTGLRYDPAQVRLDEVVAPPYDVVGSHERDLLAHRSPYNAIHLELPEPDLRSGKDRYLAAAELLDAWLERGVLVAERAPALYPYRMTGPDGATTTGVIGALAIADDVLPHEQTLPKPRSDRLDLLRATGANLSPIWGLSLATGLTATFAPQGPPAAEAHDDEGVRHQLWVMDDPVAIAAVAEGVAGAPVVIADGHHRYETARTYREQVRAATGDRPGDADAVMALVVELTADELHVGPIHRLVSGAAAAVEVARAFEAWFDVVHAGTASERVLRALGESGSLALLTAEDAWLLTPQEGASRTVGSDLETALVDHALGSVPGASLAYCATWKEAAAAVTGGEAQAAVLVRPVSVEQIAEWARAGRRMPPKTTYFRPKPRTGMVLRLLSN